MISGGRKLKGNPDPGNCKGHKLRVMGIAQLILFTLALSGTLATTTTTTSLEDMICGVGPQPHNQVILATPVATFHNVTLQIYKKVLEEHGVNVRSITSVEHAKMYPFFTGANGTRQCVDLVVSSDLPNNHAPWLKNYTDRWSTAGTSYELLQAPVFTHNP